MMSRKSGWLVGSVVAAAVLVMAGPIQAAPELKMDLRALSVSGAGALDQVINDKLVTLDLTSVGDVVTVGLYAMVKDEGALDDGFQTTQCGIRSSDGGLLGDLAASLVAGFNDGTYSYNPTPATGVHDSDPDKDVPNTASASTDLFMPHSGTSVKKDGYAVEGSYKVWLVGTAEFTVLAQGLAMGMTTDITYVPRTGTTVIKPHKFMAEGASISLKGTDLVLGDAVTINIVPEPATLALLGLGAGALVLRRRR